MHMSDLKILIFPDPKLRKVAKKIDKFDKSLEMLSKNMLKTMYEAEGIGLAATQVDIHIRLVVMDLSEERNEPRVFVNPEYTILDKSPFTYEEGCLSIPGFNEEISRPSKILLKWQDLQGNFHEEKQWYLCFYLYLYRCLKQKYFYFRSQISIKFLNSFSQFKLLYFSS